MKCTKHVDPRDPETTHIEITPSPPRRPSFSWRKAIWGCIAGIGITIGAIFSSQSDKVTLHNPPVLQAVTATDYQVVQPYAVTVKVAKVTYVIEIEPGLVTDGASIPRGVQTLLGLNPFSPVLIRGALVHDTLYRGELIDQDTADLILRQLIVEDGCNKLKAEEIYHKVRDFGARAWEDHTEASVQEARAFVRLRVMGR